MSAMVLLKRVGRTAALATVLMSGPALVPGVLQAPAAHSAGGQHGAGHGSETAVRQEDGRQEDGQAGGHGGYGAHSGWPEPQQLGGDFSLTDHTGRKVTLADFKGKATALYFGYTQCDDICPIIGTKLGMAVDLMGDKADYINIAMVSVDDRNDGPKELAAFVAKQHPRLIGLSGTRGEIYDIAAKFRVRRDYVMQNQLANEGDQPSDGHGEHAAEAHGQHGTTGHEKVPEEAPVVPAAASVDAAQAGPGVTDAPRSPGQRIRIRSASDDATRLHNMAMAHTTHIYLLNKEGQVVRYIYPSMSPENLAKRLTDLVDER